jgi:3-hydroxyisobutyrate dehydrogenase
MMTFKSRRLAAGRFEQPDFRLSLMAKDLLLAADQSAAAGLRLPLLAAAAATHLRAAEQGHGDEDCVAVARALTAASAAPTDPWKGK